MRVKTLIVTVAVPTLVGVGAAIAITPARASASNAFDCEMNVCSTESGNCTMSDVHLSCREVTGGCHTDGCSAS